MIAPSQQAMYPLQIANAIELNNQGVNSLNSDQLELAEKLISQSLGLFHGVLRECSLTSPSLLCPSKNPKIMNRDGKDYDEGMNAFSGGLMLDEDSVTSEHALATILYNHGQCCCAKNELEEGYKLFHAALALVQYCDLYIPIKGGGAIQRLRELLFYSVGTIEFRNGQYEDAINSYTRGLHIGKAGAAKGRQQILNMAAAFNCLGVLHFHLPQSETEKAITYCRTSLQTYRSVIGKNVHSKEIATVINNIGRIHFLRGEHSQALSVYREAFSMRQRLFGSNNMDTAATAFNLAQTSHALQDHETALAFYRDFLAAAQNHLGVQHHDVAAAMKCLAEVFHDMQDFEKARQLYLEALAIGKEANCCCPEEIAGMLNKLGNLYYETGDYDASLSTYTEELIIERATLGDGHINVAITCTNIGQIYKRRNDYEKALSMYTQALQIQKKCIKVPNADFALTMASIAFLYSQTNRLMEAFAAYQEVLWIQRETIGENSLELSSTLNSIGLLLYKMGEHDLALASFQESYRIRKKVHGDHHDVGVVLYNMATVHLDRSDDDKALEYYYETLRVERQCSGKCCSNVTILKLIGQVHQRNGRLEEATEYYRKCLDALLSATEHDHSEIACIFSHIGCAHMQYGQAKEAVESCSEALRHLQLAGKDPCQDFKVFGLHFYSLSKMHPNCSPAA